MYIADSDGVSYLLMHIEAPGEYLTHLTLDEGEILSPIAPAMLILFGPDGEKLTYNAVYGRLPNGIVMIAVYGEIFPVDWYEDGCYMARVILDPFTAFDEHVVDDVVFHLLEEDD